MLNLINKKYLILNTILFVIEIIMISLLITNYLKKDYISPNDVTFYDHIFNKIITIL